MFIRTRFLVAPVSAAALATATLGFSLLPTHAQQPPAKAKAQSKPDAKKKGGGPFQGIPRPGIALEDATRERLAGKLATLKDAITPLEARSKTDAKLAELLPDVQIFERAVRVALERGEFFAPNEVEKADGLIKAGLERAEALSIGQAPWTRQTGLVVRGYRSRLDDTVIPYGLVVPENYRPGGNDAFRLDLWFHGRNETLSEVNFLDERMKRPGEFTPASTIVLHPYGRYCNAFKFAGEVDVLEALQDVRARYRVDDNRVSVRGFSMGGAGAWHFAVHHTDKFFAANPGAGFAETARFSNLPRPGQAAPTWYQKQLWHLYDATDTALNLMNLPTIAYSGEIDRQKQAADVMAEAMARDGMTLTHIIGPKTEHRYHPDSKLEVERRLASLASFGRVAMPSEVWLSTYTLRYPKMHWVTIEGMVRHWEEAEVRARITAAARVEIVTANVTALTLDIPAGGVSFPVNAPVTLLINGSQNLDAPRALSDRSWRCSLVLGDDGATWQIGTPGPGLRKQPGLQGPIDDAFLDRFVMVAPSGASSSAAVNEWVAKEQAIALDRWRRGLRGEPITRADTAVTDADIASSNLILWGDPTSNAVIRKIADQLPIRWVGDQIVAGDRKFNAADNIPVMIYPNPLNPKRYVVLNSGITFRAMDDSSNALQVPKLPDWAIIDARTEPGKVSAGRVVAADFFGEKWELLPARAE